MSKEPDCLFPEELESLIRELRYIRKQNFDRQNGKCSEASTYQHIRDKTTDLIERYMFILTKRRT